MNPLLALLLAQTAAAEPDVGRYRINDFQPAEARRQPRDVLDAAKLPPMAKLGSDAIRFSSTPALGGKAIIVQARRRDGQAQVTVVRLEGHERRGWKELDRTTKVISADRYARLARRIDKLLSDWRTRTVSPNDEMTICLDGPGYLIERVRRGAVVSLAGFCEHRHPNNEIAKMMSELAGDLQ